MSKNSKASPFTPDADGYPGACRKIAKAQAVPLRDLIAILKAWRLEHPEALQLDGHPSGRNNLKPWLHFKLTGFSSPLHDFQAKHSGELILGDFYNGIWNLHGDAKASAIDAFIAVASSTTNPTVFLKRTATHEQKTEHSGDQNPKLTLEEGTGVKDFFLYQ